jgi:hypothetical protein
LNVTEPVGVPATGDTIDTVACSVADWPTITGVGLNVRTVFVVSRLTVTAEAVEVEVLSLASPE